MRKIIYIPILKKIILIYIYLKYQNILVNYLHKTEIQNAKMKMFLKRKKLWKKHLLSRSQIRKKKFSKKDKKFLKYTYLLLFWEKIISNLKLQNNKPVFSKKTAETQKNIFISIF